MLGSELSIDALKDLVYFKRIEAANGLKIDTSAFFECMVVNYSPAKTGFLGWLGVSSGMIAADGEYYLRMLVNRA